MNTPSGFVIARIRARNRPICIQPLAVISEFLRPEQRVQQIDHQARADDEHDDRFGIHNDFSSANAIAEMHVPQRQHKKRDRHHDKDQVLHSHLPFTRDDITNRT